MAPRRKFTSLFPEDVGLNLPSKFFEERERTAIITAITQSQAGSILDRLQSSYLTFEQTF